MCDSLVARGDRTRDGATLFAKNSDRRGREPQPFVQMPAAFHPRGSTLRCSHVEIDQVAETYRVMGHSPAWCWGFEQGVNEHGVAIGNHATWSREALEHGPGLIGMDLVRLGLERGRDAREALEVMASLIERHGQGGSAFGPSGDAGYQNSFVIADGRSAWILETTARGWAARRVEAAALTNSLTLTSDWQIASHDLARDAKAQGFWSRDGRLDFKAAYAVEDVPDYLTARRRRAANECLAGGPLDLAAMKGWLRDHGAGSIPPRSDRDFEDPDRYSICMHADPLSTTTASLIARLPELNDRRPWPVWISFATPCTGLFIPVYLDGVIPACLAASGIWATDSERSGVTTASALDLSSGASLWCALRQLQEDATRDFEHALPILQAHWGRVEREVELDRVRIEEQVAGFYVDDEVEQGVRTLTAFMERTAQRVLEETRSIRAALS